MHPAFVCSRLILRQGLDVLDRLQILSRQFYRANFPRRSRQFVQYLDGPLVHIHERIIPAEILHIPPNPLNSASDDAIVVVEVEKGTTQVDSGRTM